MGSEEEEALSSRALEATNQRCGFLRKRFALARAEAWQLELPDGGNLS